MRTKTKKQLFIGFILMNLLIILDQITKKLAVIYLKDKPAIPIIKDVFELKDYIKKYAKYIGLYQDEIIYIFNSKKYIKLWILNYLRG